MIDIVLDVTLSGKVSVIGTVVSMLLPGYYSVLLHYRGNYWAVRTVGIKRVLGFHYRDTD